MLFNAFLRDSEMLNGHWWIAFQSRSKLLIVLLLSEAAVLSARFDASTIFRSIGKTNLFFAGGSLWFIHFLISFAAIFGIFAYLKFGGELRAIVLKEESKNFPLHYLAGHFAAVTAFAFCSESLSAESATASLFILWILSGLATLLFAAIAVLSLPVWATVIRATGWLGLYSVLSASLCASAVSQSWKLWDTFSQSTFYLVVTILKPILPHMHVDPSRLVIGSDRFQVVIASSCSGLEGVALLLVFLTLWLLLFRDEIRFPQAFLLIPIGVAILYLINAVRIAALIWIGHSGLRDVALQGFHSQAGWIAFNFVALGISAGARKVPWIQRRAVSESGLERKRPILNADAVYLLPFLAILICGMLSRAASGKFEWFYGFRLIGAAIPLWFLRHKYQCLVTKLDWGAAICSGAGVFLFWIALDGLLGQPLQTTGRPVTLMASSRPLWMGWVLVRVFTAITVVPIAEELAFRGYLMRRLVTENFRAVQPQKAGLPAVLASSLLFGLLHGSRWVAGTGAGYCYAMVYARRGSLSSAMLAHGSYQSPVGSLRSSNGPLVFLVTIRVAKHEPLV